MLASIDETVSSHGRRRGLRKMPPHVNGFSRSVHRPTRATRRRVVGCLALVASFSSCLVGCGRRDSTRLEPASDASYALAGGCFVMSAGSTAADAGTVLAVGDAGSEFAFVGRDLARAARLIAEPADLGVYLLRDAERRYLVATQSHALGRVQTLESDMTRNEDGYVSPALWGVEGVAGHGGTFVLRSRATGAWLGTDGLVDTAAHAARITFEPATGCTPFEELSVDASGSVDRTHFEDGDLFGFVDAHEHVFTHLAFGAGGVFHGAPYHPLGVEHALRSCEASHGRDGRRDVVSYVFDGGSLDVEAMLRVLLTGDLGGFHHHTEGYPEFTDWPKAWGSSTHQTLYYRWLERAYLAGMRLMVQHAVSNEVLCTLTSAARTQEPRISCDEMVSVDREIEATRDLERYIDAHAGGPGKGWFRIVTSPADARRVIADGKLAVILGIETSNLFDCFLEPRPGFPRCDEAMVRAKLDRYHALGVRGLFPVHKFDNGFSAGDGHRGILELGNVLNSGRLLNFTEVACPDVPAVFDWGAITFGGLNAPRAEYVAPPPIDFPSLQATPFQALVPYLGRLLAPSLTGNYCQNAGLQPLGETLLIEMMRRGMIIEVDHLPRRAYERAYELLHEYDYPAVGSHGSDNRGDLYTLGGVSTSGVPRCQTPGDPDVARGFRERIASIADRGGYPAQGFGFDFNGFAGGPRPRFGPDSGCPGGQANRMTYPFTSYGGDVVFDAPRLGNRLVDFDDEGMIHIGLLPELIQDARNMGMSDADLEPLFRSAEGYLRMWERAEARGAALQ